MSYTDELREVKEQIKEMGVEVTETKVRVFNGLSSLPSEVEYGGVVRNGSGGELPCERGGREGNGAGFLCCG